ETELQIVLNQSFKPEFLNRIDDIVIFNRISRELMLQIVDRELTKTKKALSDNKHIQLNVSDKVKSQLAEEGYDPSFGARPLRRLMQSKILNPLSQEIVSGNIQEGSVVMVESKDGQIIFA